MESSKSSNAVRFSKAFADVCDGVMDALETGERHGSDHGGLDVLFVLARALKKKPRATPDKLAAAWAAEVDDWEVDHEVIEAVLSMHAWLGSEWYVFLIAIGFFKEDCFYAGASTDDLLGEARRNWERWVKEYDAKRAKEKEAALTWLSRHLKKVA